MNKVKRLPLFSNFVVNESESFKGIFFEGNIITRANITPRKESVFMFRRFEGLEFEKGLKMTKDSHNEALRLWDETPLNSGDFILVFKSSKYLKSVISNLQKILELQIEKEREENHE